MSTQPHPSLSQIDRTNLIQFLHDLADEIAAGTAIPYGWEIESGKGVSPVILTGRRLMRLWWYDERSRVAIK